MKLSASEFVARLYRGAAVDPSTVIHCRHQDDVADVYAAIAATVVREKNEGALALLHEGTNHDAFEVREWATEALVKLGVLPPEELECVV